MDTYKQWLENPTAENAAKLLKELEPTINAEIQRYSGPKTLLKSKAKVLAINAIKKYNPSSGANLKSWVVTNLQPLSRYSNQLKPVYSPEESVRHAAEINRVFNELQDELGRPPTDEELADKVGISVRRVKQLRSQVKPYVIEGSLSIGGDDDDSASSLPGIDIDESLQSAANLVYESLDDRDKMIFDLKTGKRGGKALPNHEIAKRLGVSPAFVSQRSAAIAEEINKIKNSGVI